MQERAAVRINFVKVHEVHGVASAPSSGPSEGSSGTVVCARCWSRDNGGASLGEFQAHQGGEENLAVRHTNPAICDKYSLV